MDMPHTYEYINEFMYFVIQPDESRGKGAYIYCSGADMFRFLPITRGRHGLASNSTLRGLQLVNLAIRDMALAKGVTITPLKGECSQFAPTKGGWYSERLLIEHAPESFLEEIINYAVVHFLKKIVKACALPDAVPDKLLPPDELQAFIESLCNKYQGNHDLKDCPRGR